MFPRILVFLAPFDGLVKRGRSHRSPSPLCSEIWKGRLGFNFRESSAGGGNCQVMQYPLCKPHYPVGRHRGVVCCALWACYSFPQSHFRMTFCITLLIAVFSCVCGGGGWQNKSATIRQFSKTWITFDKVFFYFIWEAALSLLMGNLGSAI